MLILLKQFVEKESCEFLKFILIRLLQLQKASVEMYPSLALITTVFKFGQLSIALFETPIFRHVIFITSILELVKESKPKVKLRVLLFITKLVILQL